MDASMILQIKPELTRFLHQFDGYFGRITTRRRASALAISIICSFESVRSFTPTCLEPSLPSLSSGVPVTSGWQDTAAAQIIEISNSIFIFMNEPSIHVPSDSK
jgi:hypothetical protein